MQLTIDYSTEKEQLEKAIDTLEAVLESSGEEFEKAELVPGQDVFRVSIDGEVVFDLGKTGFSVKKIKENVEKYIEER